MTMDDVMQLVIVCIITVMLLVLVPYLGASWPSTDRGYQHFTEQNTESYQESTDTRAQVVKETVR